MIVNKRIDHRPFRKANYMPLEDQIDAIVKCLKHLQSNGLDLGPDIQEIIEHRDSVKAAHPNKQHIPIE